MMDARGNAQAWFQIALLIGKGGNSLSTDRRNFLKQAGLMGSIGILAGSPSAGALATDSGLTTVAEDSLPLQPEEPPQHHIKFAVCGMSHDHIYGMVGAIQRGGGELVAAWGGEEDKLAAFTKRFPAVRIAKTQEEILK